MHGGPAPCGDERHDLRALQGSSRRMRGGVPPQLDVGGVPGVRARSVAAGLLPPVPHAGPERRGVQGVPRGAARGRGRRRARLQAVGRVPMVQRHGVLRAAVGAGAARAGGVRGQVFAGPPRRCAAGRRRRGPSRVHCLCRLALVCSNGVMHPPLGGGHPDGGGVHGQVRAEARACDGPGRRRRRARLHPLSRLLVVRDNGRVHSAMGARHALRGGG
mmetsp:Transcript_42863/g.133825  ORF Transcript_42863/g.133825 Transcript_42863/m.133825 type:complete len:217 (+) Transcript_42863:195-845(+)